MVGKRTPGSVPERGTSLNPKPRNVAGKVVMCYLLAGLSRAVGRLAARARSAMPRRRTYVDAVGRATTTIALRRITPRRVSGRDFRVF
jgi:hypothetical protein